jgi:hypothetical protein
MGLSRASVLLPLLMLPLLMRVLFPLVKLTLMTLR